MYWDVQELYLRLSIVSVFAHAPSTGTAASGRLFGRLLSRECVRSYLGLHPPSWVTFPEGVSMERDLVECTQASSARWANRLINDHYGPHRSSWYRRSFTSGNLGRHRGKRSSGAHSEELDSDPAFVRPRGANGKAVSELNLAGWYRYQFQSAQNSLELLLICPEHQKHIAGRMIAVLLWLSQQQPQQQ